MPSLDSLSGKTVLITGATGFIGNHLVRRLSNEKNIRIVCLSHKAVANNQDNIMWINSGLEKLSEKIWQNANIEKIDIVFHFGAFTPKNAQSANSIDEIYRDNILGTWSLLKSMAQLSPRIIFASTLDVYALMKSDFIDEISPLGPQDLYGASKLFCEHLIRSYAVQRDSDYAILRFGHIYGPGEEEYEKFIPRTIRRLIKGEAPILQDNGEVQRDYLYVGDAVEAALRAAISSDRQLGPINIVRGCSNSIRSITEVLVKATDFQGFVEYSSEPSKRHSLLFNNNKMKKELGDWELTSLEEGLRDEVTYFRGLRK